MSKEGKIGRSDCGTASALEIVGDRWSLLIIRDFIFVGRREYNDFMELREHISTNILANRLQWLTEVGIFTKHAHPTNKKKYYYEITDKGFDLIVVIMELAQWSWSYIPGAWTPPEIKSQFKKNRNAFVQHWRKTVKKQSQDYLKIAKIKK